MIKRIEFIVTNACTSKCRHCSVIDDRSNDMLDKDVACSCLNDLLKQFHPQSIMTFGGEPLLALKTTLGIHQMAAQFGVEQRQLITNGCPVRNQEQLLNIAGQVARCGANNILISVDAFHQEFLPIELVYQFAKKLKQDYTGKLQLHPAWVVNKSVQNPYNEKTKKILSYFDDLHISVNQGNNIFLSGNAKRYLAEYYTQDDVSLDLDFICGKAPYTAALDCLDCISISPNGDVTPCCYPIGNINNDNIINILSNYSPDKFPMTKALYNNGIRGLIDFAKENEINIDPWQYRFACDYCHDVCKKLFLKMEG